MKFLNVNTLFILISILLCNTAISQVVDGITYQAVAIDENGKEIPGMDINGNILSGKTIAVRFTILSGNILGEKVYQEVHTTNTDYNGLFSVVIGHGVITGFSQNKSILDVKWGSDKHFLKVELDIDGFGSFKIMGIQQLMAAPYALYALKTDNTIIGQEGTPGQDGVGIESVTDNNDGTFTLNFTDNSSFTTIDFTGLQGADGVGIELVTDNEDGTFTLFFTDGSSFTTMNLTGQDGTDGVGIELVTDNGNGTFTLHFTDETTFTTIDLTGLQGEEGIGIESVTDNGDGSFTLNFTDGSAFTTIDLTGQQGADGVGIESVTDNEDGSFTLNFTDGSEFTTMDLIGPQGEKGVGIESVTDNQDGTFTLNFTDGSAFTTIKLTGPQGDIGIGIFSAIHNSNGTLTINFTDGSSYTTTDLTGLQGEPGADGRSFKIKGELESAEDLPEDGNEFGDGYFIGADKELYYWGIYIDEFDDWIEGWVNYGILVGLQGPQGEQGDKGDDGIGISSTIHNSNGTLTINFTDGSSYTTENLSGEQGETGVGIESTTDNGDGTFTLNFSDGTSFTTIDLRGEDGVGIESTTDNGDGTFTLNFSDGTSFTTIDLRGEDGVGIESTTDNGNGTFTLNFTDGSTFTTIDLTGPQGNTGVGISSVSDNGDGSFTLYFTDGSSFTTMDLTGPQGHVGEEGTFVISYLPQKHIIEVWNNYFDPVLLHVNKGDTVEFVWKEGIHTTTTDETSGEDVWDETLNLSQTSYSHVISGSNNISYYCKIYGNIGGTGMAGIIIIDNPDDIVDGNIMQITNLDFRNALPVGAIISYAGTNLPQGFLICDGAQVSREKYSKLYDVLEDSWGEGDGNTTFNLPDLRGQFLRGVDGTADIDPDKNSRTALFPGGNTGNNVGTYQQDEFKSHNHSVPRCKLGSTASGDLPPPAVSSCATSSWNTNSSGGLETRPKNAYVYFIIRYK